MPEVLIERFFSWSERYFKTDMRYIASGGFWLALAQVALALIAFLLSVAFAHFVSKESYGTYRFLLSVFWTLTAFSLTGLPTALIQAVARGFEGTYRRAFRLTLLWGIPVFLISLGMSVYYFLHGNALLFAGMLIIAVLGPLVQPAYLYGAFLEGKRDFKLAALLTIATNTVPAVLSLSAMFYTDSAVVFLLCYLIGNVFTGFLCSWYLFYRYKPNAAVNDDFGKLSGHFSAMNILFTLVQQVDRLLVFHYTGAAALATYSFAIAFPEQIKNVFNSIAILALPRFAQRPFHEVESNFWGRLLQFSFLLVLVTIVYNLIAAPLFYIFFPAYMDAVFYSQIYALSLFAVSNSIPISLLQAHAATRELYVFNIASPVFQIAILFFGIAWWGIMGAVVARIIGRVVTLLLAALLVKIYARRTVSVS